MGDSVRPPLETSTTAVLAAMTKKTYIAKWTDPSGQVHTINFRMALND